MIVPELEKCLDPEYTDQLTLSQSAKADIILTGKFACKYLKKISQKVILLVSEKYCLRVLKNKCWPLNLKQD